MAPSSTALAKLNTANVCALLDHRAFLLFKGPLRDFAMQHAPEDVVTRLRRRMSRFPLLSLRLLRVVLHSSHSSEQATKNQKKTKTKISAHL